MFYQVLIFIKLISFVEKKKIGMKENKRQWQRKLKYIKEFKKLQYILHVIRVGQDLRCKYKRERERGLELDRKRDCPISRDKYALVIDKDLNCYVI